MLSFGRSFPAVTMDIQHAEELVDLIACNILKTKRGFDCDLAVQ